MESYYYVLNGNRKLYYRGGIRIAKKDIPYHILPTIQENKTKKQEDDVAKAKIKLSKLRDQLSKLRLKEAKVVAEIAKLEDKLRQEQNKKTTAILSTSEKFLASLGISNLKTWKEWMRNNHPDKFTDPQVAKEKGELCGRVNQAVNTMGWKS